MQKKEQAKTTRLALRCVLSALAVAAISGLQACKKGTFASQKNIFTTSSSGGTRHILPVPYVLTSGSSGYCIYESEKRFTADTMLEVLENPAQSTAILLTPTKMPGHIWTGLLELLPNVGAGLAEATRQLAAFLITQHFVGPLQPAPAPAAAGFNLEESALILPKRELLLPKNAGQIWTAPQSGLGPEDISRLLSGNLELVRMNARGRTAWLSAFFGKSGLDLAEHQKLAELLELLAGDPSQGSDFLRRLEKIRGTVRPEEFWANLKQSAAAGDGRLKALLDGLPRAESDPLIIDLAEHVTKPEVKKNIGALVTVSEAQGSARKASRDMILTLEEFKRKAAQEVAKRGGAAPPSSAIVKWESAITGGLARQTPAIETITVELNPVSAVAKKRGVLPPVFNDSPQLLLPSAEMRAAAAKNPVKADNPGASTTGTKPNDPVPPGGQKPGTGKASGTPKDPIPGVKTSGKGLGNEVADVLTKNGDDVGKKAKGLCGGLWRALMCAGATALAFVTVGALVAGTSPTSITTPGVASDPSAQGTSGVNLDVFRGREDLFPEAEVPEATFEAFVSWVQSDLVARVSHGAQDSCPVTGGGLRARTGPNSDPSLDPNKLGGVQ